MFSQQPPPVEKQPPLLKKAAVICSSLILGGIVIGLSCTRGEDSAAEAEPLPSTKRGLVSVPVQSAAEERLLPGTKSSAAFTNDSMHLLLQRPQQQTRETTSDADFPLAAGEPGHARILPGTKVMVIDTGRPTVQLFSEIPLLRRLFEGAPPPLAAEPVIQPSRRPEVLLPGTKSGRAVSASDLNVLFNRDQLPPRFTGNPFEPQPATQPTSQPATRAVEEGP